MRVPDAHNEASAALAEPIGHNADHARPTCCLEHPAGNLNQVNIELVITDFMSSETNSPFKIMISVAI